MRLHYGLPAVVAVNRFAADTPAELALVESRMAACSVPAVLAAHWAEGGRGALDLARAVVELCERTPQVRYVYDDGDTLWEKIDKIARKIYRASQVTAGPKVREQIDRLAAATLRQPRPWGKLGAGIPEWRAPGAPACRGPR